MTWQSAVTETNGLQQQITKMFGTEPCDEARHGEVRESIDEVQVDGDLIQSRFNVFLGII